MFRLSMSSWYVRSVYSSPAMAQPLSPGDPPTHQPSRTDRLLPPLTQTYMPLGPEATRGRRGLLSQTSTPWTR